MMATGKKKTFAGKITAANPAVAFLSEPVEQVKPVKPVTMVKQVSTADMDKQVNMVRMVKPDVPATKYTFNISTPVLEDLRKIATMRRISVTTLINSELDEFCRTEAITVKRYDDTFGA
jgi:hypothetical protein